MMNRRVAPAEAPGKVKKASSWRGARVGGEGAPPAPVARGASFPVATGLWKAEAAPRREARVVPEGAAPRSASSRVAPDGADVEDGLRAGEDGRVAPLLALDDGDGDGLGGSARQRGGGRGAAKVAPAGGGGDADARARGACGEWVGRCAAFGRRNAWLQRLWLVVDRVQGLALIWLMAQAWPWPPIWLHLTRWLPWVLADAPALGANGAGLGSTGELGRSVHGRTPDWLLAAAAPTVALAFAALAADGALRSERARLFCGEADAAAEHRPYDATAPRSAATARAWAASAATRLAILAYAPCGLVLARLFHCERGANGAIGAGFAGGGGGGQRLAADPAVGCLAAELSAYEAGPETGDFDVPSTRV